MSRRLPQPPDPKRVRLVVSDEELLALEKMAADCRLSLASFVRALVVGAAKHWPASEAATKEAASIIDSTRSDLPKPGRPSNASKSAKLKKK